MKRTMMKGPESKRQRRQEQTPRLPRTYMEAVALGHEDSGSHDYVETYPTPNVRVEKGYAELGDGIDVPYVATFRYGRPCARKNARERHVSMDKRCAQRVGQV
jgi:hypothetical protein